ncbi:MAG: DNA-directed RNA polymerase subunit omega [Blastocatellia bacterium]
MKNVMSENRFLKVLITAQRAKQIHKGARPLVQNSNTRATRIALDEVERGLIGFEFLSQNPDLRSGRDNRGDGDRETNREVTNQLQDEVSP